MSKSLTILLVDNDPDYLLIRRELLEMSGYSVYSASSAVEAKRVLDSNVVHIAVLDMRLSNDTDEHDTSGLSLARDIDQSVYKIVQTKWPTYTHVREALSITDDGLPLAIDFVDKSRDANAFIKAVESAGSKYVRANFSLRVRFAGGLSPGGLLPADVTRRDPAARRVSEAVLVEEVEDLLRKLFCDYAEVTVSPFTPPLAGGERSRFLRAGRRGVTFVEAHRAGAGGAAETVIVKLAPRELARKEWETYKNVYFDRAARPLFETYAETQRLGGAVYVPTPAPERFGIVYWDGALMAWSDAAAGAGERDMGKFKSGAEAVALCLGERLGARLTHPAAGGEGFIYGVLDTSGVFPEPQMPNDLPVIFLYGSAVEAAALDRLHAAPGGPPLRASGMALLFAFNPPGDVERLRRRLKKRLTRTYAWDVITAGQSELRAVVAAESPVKELRSLVLSQIDIHRVSPFQSVGETPDNVFFGREAELRTISRHARVASYAVIAGRRFGKTSLLGQLHRARLPAEGLHTVYHDLSLTPTLADLRAASIRSWRAEPPAHAPSTFGELFDVPPSNRPLVLLLDEADKAVGPDRRDEWRLFNHLRALSHAGDFRVVLSGEHTLRDALREPDSPLFNFAHELLLGPLDYGAVTELVTRPMGQMEIRLEDEASVVKQIYDFTSGHPNIVQRLCSRLIERLNETGSRLISLEDVNAVIADPDFKQTDFLGTYWDRATHLEKIITLLMSRDPRRRRTVEVCALLEREAGISPGADAVQGALDRLTDIRSILGRSVGGYDFAVAAFPRVLNDTVTLEDLLGVLLAQLRRSEVSA